MDSVYVNNERVAFLVLLILVVFLCNRLLRDTTCIESYISNSMGWGCLWILSQEYSSEINK